MSQSPLYSPYDFDSNFLDIGGLRYHYLDEGSGPVLILLHGNPSWSFMYRDLVAALRESYRVIVPDHIGCGLSDKPDDSGYSYRLAERVSNLESLVDELGLAGDLTLCMHDWGGPIGLTFAVRRPERIARLVLFNTTAFLPAGKSLHWTIRWCRSSRLMGYLIRRFNIFAAGAARIGCRRRKMTSSVRRAYLAPYDSWANRIAVLRFVQDIPLGPDHPTFELLDSTQAKLHRLENVPALICWGEKDFVFDLDFLAEWEKRLPAAEVHRFPKAGHYVVEDAGDRILPLIEDFLARHPLDGGRQ